MGAVLNRQSEYQADPGNAHQDHRRAYLKFGADYPHAWIFYGTNAFYNILQGAYNFNGSVMSALFGPRRRNTVCFLPVGLSG